MLFALLPRAREGHPAAGGFDPGGAELWGLFGASRSKPLAEGVRGVCALWHFRLGDRALDPWACGRRTRAANEGKTRRLLINRPGSSVAFLKSDSNERLRVSNWIVQRLLSDCEGKVHGLPTVR